MNEEKNVPITLRRKIYAYHKRSKYIFQYRSQKNPQTGRKIISEYSLFTAATDI